MALYFPQERPKPRLGGTGNSFVSSLTVIVLPGRASSGFQNELTEVVGNILRHGLAPIIETGTRVARERVPAEQLDDFVRMATNDLENLHKGNFARFRLRPSEFHGRSELQRHLNERSG